MPFNLPRYTLYQWWVIQSQQSPPECQLSFQICVLWISLLINHKCCLPRVRRSTCRLSHVSASVARWLAGLNISDCHLQLQVVFLIPRPPYPEIIQLGLPNRHRYIFKCLTLVLVLNNLSTIVDSDVFVQNHFEKNKVTLKEDPRNRGRKGRNGISCPGLLNYFD